MSLLTNWGYTLTGVDALPDMMDDIEYALITGRNDDSQRVLSEISAASAAARNYVGWHLYPSLACKLNTIISDRRVVFSGRDVIIQLPARYVTAVSSVVINDAAYNNYHLDPSGLLHVFDVGTAMTRYASVVVEYTAGLTDAMMAPIRDMLSSRVVSAISLPPGITSEASGGVSVTYNAAWINNSGAGGLMNANKELLVPYRVQGVF